MGSILLVESDPSISELWTFALSEAGHSVVAVRMLREVLTIVREGGIDAVVVDTHEPRHGVADLARALAALPDGPPLVLISGSPDAPEMSARIGAAAFLPTPCETSELVAIANRLVGALRPVRIVEDDPTGPSRPVF